MSRRHDNLRAFAHGLVAIVVCGVLFVAAVAAILPTLAPFTFAMAVLSLLAASTQRQRAPSASRLVVVVASLTLVESVVAPVLFIVHANNDYDERMKASTTTTVRLDETERAYTRESAQQFLSDLYLVPDIEQVANHGPVGTDVATVARCWPHPVPQLAELVSVEPKAPVLQEGPLQYPVRLVYRIEGRRFEAWIDIWPALRKWRVISVVATDPPMSGLDGSSSPVVTSDPACPAWLPPSG